MAAARRAAARHWIPILAVAILVSIPVVFGGRFFVSYMADVLLLGLVALGLQLMVGTAGVLNLGQAAFFGLGAYGAGYVALHWGWGSLASLAAGVAVALAGAALTLPMLRLRGLYFAMATFAFGLVLFEVFRLAVPLTGGDNGLYGIPPPSVLGLELATTDRFYYLALAVALATYAAYELLARSKLGLALSVVRQSEVAARASGVNVALVRAIAVAAGVVPAALAGSLYAQFHSAITPPLFSADQSVALLAMVIIGGVHSRWGAFAGAAFALLLSSYLRFLLEFQVLTYGLAIAAFVVLLPGGLASLPALLRAGWERRSLARAAAP